MQMRIRLMLPIVAAATVALATPSHADDTDQAFLSDLDTAGIHYGDPDKAVTAGKTVCSLKDTGMSDDDVVSNLTGQNDGFTQAKATKFETIATNDYCPAGDEPAAGDSPGEPGATNETGPPSGTTTH